MDPNSPVVGAGHCSQFGGKRRNNTHNDTPGHRTHHTGRHLSGASHHATPCTVRDAAMTRADTLLAELKGTLQPDTRLAGPGNHIQITGAGVQASPRHVTSRSVSVCLSPQARGDGGGGPSGGPGGYQERAGVCSRALVNIKIS